MAGLVAAEVHLRLPWDTAEVWPLACPAKAARAAVRCQRMDQDGRVFTCPLLVALCALEGPTERVTLGHLCAVLDRRGAPAAHTTVICQLGSAQGLAVGA